MSTPDDKTKTTPNQESGTEQEDVNNMDAPVIGDKHGDDISNDNNDNTNHDDGIDMDAEGQSDEHGDTHDENNDLEAA